MKRKTMQACLVGLCIAVSVPGRVYACETGSEILAQSATEEAAEQSEAQTQETTDKEKEEEKEEIQETAENQTEAEEEKQTAGKDDTDEKEEKADVPDAGQQPAPAKTEKQPENEEKTAKPVDTYEAVSDDAAVSGLPETQEAEQAAHELTVSVNKALDETKTYIQNTEQELSLGKEGYVFGLARNGVKADSAILQKYYESIARYLAGHKGKLPDGSDGSRYAALILTMTAMGKDARSIAGYNLFETLADFDTVKKQGVSCAAWTLLAVNSHDVYTIPQVNSANARTTEEKLLAYILEKENAQGGWPAEETENEPDPETTGLVLQALAPYNQKKGYEKVTEAVERALTCLSMLQNEDGGFSGGENPAKSTAQAVAGLCALGIDPKEDVRFVKNGNWTVEYLMAYYVSGGGFAAEMPDMSQNRKDAVDQEVTEKAYCALTAYQRLKENKTSLYDMKDMQLTKGETIKDSTDDQKQPSKEDSKDNTDKPKEDESSAKPEEDTKKEDTKKEDTKKENTTEKEQKDKDTKKKTKLKLTGKTGKKLTLAKSTGKKLTLSSKTGKKVMLTRNTAAKKLTLSDSTDKKGTSTEQTADSEPAESGLDELDMESSELQDTETEETGKKLTLSDVTASSAVSELPETAVTAADDAQNQMEAGANITETKSVEAKQHTKVPAVALIITGILLAACGFFVYLRKKKQ